MKLTVYNVCTSVQKMARKLEPKKTQTAILEAALTCFADHGYAGTSIADVARQAGVLKSHVQYHFKTKEQLWQACLAHRAAPVIQALDAFLHGKISAPELIRARMALLTDHPEVGRLLAWASMEPVPLPSFIEERREGVLSHFGQNACSPECLRLLFGIAAMDGWFLFRNLYRRLVGDSIFDHGVERLLLEELLAQQGVAGA